jgi:DNA-binding response OmpR family regulator
MSDVTRAEGPLAQILVVEDNAQLMGLLAEFLRRARYGVHEAPGGHEALARQTSQAGAFDYLEKPFSFPQLTGTIAAAIRHRDRQRRRG